jgi:hypothetical protein
MLAQLIVLGILLSLPAAAADTMSCGVSTRAGVTCSCDVRTLRPLQGAIGLEEVRAKQQNITEHPKREWKDLENDPIKVIRGPANQLYITDHHHGADAWPWPANPSLFARSAWDRPLRRTRNFGRGWNGMAW